MSDQQGDYPSPTAAQSGPYPHRPTNSSATNASSVAADAQLAHQLLQATERAQQQSGEYGRGPSEQHQTTPQQQQAVAEAQQAMQQWGAAAGVSAPPPQHAMPAPAAPPPGAAQYAQYPPEMQHVMGPGQASPGDDEPTKKKQKTSRACDECRRKKIKCDGDGEKPGYKCANCLRTGAECLYTKPAQKRGPSRGYIRELSDRVASLEGMNSTMSPMTPQNSSSIFADGVDSHGVKRTHSISEHGLSELKTPQSASGTPAAPQARMGSASYPSYNARPHFGLDLPAPSKPLTSAEQDDLSTFMKAAQPGLQVLADDVKVTEHLLDSTPAPIRETFFRCLKAVNTLPTSKDRSLYKDAFSSALNLAHKPTSVSSQANVIHLQICLLLIYLSGMKAPSSADKDEPNMAIIYGTAGEIAEALQITNRPGPSNDPVDEVASAQGRRTYALLLSLSLWTALANGNGLGSLLPSHFDPASIQKDHTDAYWYAAVGSDLLDVHLLSASGSLTFYPRRLYLDGLLEGSNTTPEQLNPGVRVMKAGMSILRSVCIEPATRRYWLSQEMVKDATDIVHTLSAQMPFYIAGHQILALAVRVLILANEQDSSRDEAIETLSEARAAFEGGKLLEGAGEWGAAIEAVIEKALASSNSESGDPEFKWIDDIRSGWLRHFS